MDNVNNMKYEKKELKKKKKPKFSSGISVDFNIGSPLVKMVSDCSYCLAADYETFTVTSYTL